MSSLPAITTVKTAVYTSPHRRIVPKVSSAVVPLTSSDNESFLGADAPTIRKYWTPNLGDICFDVGGGPGSWALAAVNRGAFCYVFEPGEHAIQKIVQAGHLHKLPCCILPFGLLDKSGEALFYNGSFHNPGVSAIPTPVMSMDDFAAWAHLPRLDFINMDAEGSELRIVQGGKNTITKFHPKIIIEVHQNVSRDDLRREIETCGKYEFMDDGIFLIATPVSNQ